MPTIHDLPLEIIGRIIHIPNPLDENRRTRVKPLCRTSLVCRDWTPFAQAELWTEVY
jgi:hypothetical protein